MKYIDGYVHINNLFLKEILLGGQKAQIYMNDLITQAEELM